MLDNPHVSVSREDERLIEQQNQTASEYAADLCVHDWIETQASRTPEKTALISGDERISYTQLNSRANRLAHYLRAHGVGPDVLVGVCLERTAEMVVAVLGILKAGGAYVPLDPSYPTERIQYILEDARARLVLTSERAGSLPLRLSAEGISLDASADAIARQSDSNPEHVARSRNLAYVIYTSGSTGKPKGVQIEHRSVVNFLTSMQREPGMRAEDVLLAVTTLSFDIAGLELYLPLVCGAQVILASRTETTDGRLLMSCMEKFAVTVMQATPATWRLLLESGWRGDPKLKILCGGEALPRDLAEQLLPCCSELWNMYGPTETTIWSTIYRVRDVKWSTAPIGRPIANTQTYVLNENRELVAFGSEGELWVGGDGLARGYYRRPELTAERFALNPFSREPEARMYRTGDRVRYRQDGNLEYLGRMDNQVKIRGFRIELGEIEVLLEQHPGVKSAVVLAREDTAGDKRLVAYLLPSTHSEVTPSELRSFLKKSLPDYMLPSAFVKLDRFPLTPNRKIDRRALPAPQASDFDLESEYVAARSKVEQQLVSICEEVLGLRPIGVTTNLFELGVHSLQVARVFMRISKAFNRDLPLALLFQAPTPQQLARFLQTGSRGDPFPTLVTIQPSGSRIPLFCVHGGAGTTFYLRRLSRHLGPDQPVFGLESEGLDGHPMRRTRVEQMAAQYIGEIRRVQPVGPYLLAGYCFGGIVAFEMARQLAQAGQEAGFVGLFNAALRWRIRPPKPPAPIQNAQTRSFAKRVRVALTWRAKTLRVKARLAREAAFFGFFRIVNVPVPQSMRTRFVERALDRAEEMYRPEVYSGTITVFRGRGVCEHDPEMGWAGLAARGVQVHDIGDALQNTRREMVNEPLVAELAREVELYLNRLRNSTIDSTAGTSGGHSSGAEYKGPASSDRNNRSVA